MVLTLLVISIIGFIYSSWFTGAPLSSGDWPYLFLENIRDFSWLPEARYLWLAPYYQILTKFVVTILGIRWEIAEKLLWFFPFVALSVVSSYSFTKSWIGVLIYTTNTYILMVVGGGQMGVALAYALAPFVLGSFINHRDHFSSLSQSIKHQVSSIKRRFVLGLILAVQVMFDPRIALLTVVAAVLYWVVVQRELKGMTSWFGVPLGITFLLHTYWWVPLLINPGILRTQLHGVSSEAVKYLSFSSFSQTVSLLHPNWPENVFGKVSFMRPEFLFIPILAFGVFLWGKKQEIRSALPYGFLALLGAFLAKGAQEPFGGLYMWLFEHVPGFWLFRDSTKFYLLIALAYAYLIPAGIESLASRWKTRISVSSKILGVLFLFTWVVLIRQAITSQLSGTFQSHLIDPEYVQLKNLISSLPDGAVTYWVPSRQRFGFTSKRYPAISASDEIPGENLNAILSSLQSVDTKMRLEQEGVAYVIVPYDTAGEIFLTDRAYDHVVYMQTIETVDRISWLVPVESFTKIRVWSLRSKLQ